jgi:hypothetical protein
MKKFFIFVSTPFYHALFASLLLFLFYFVATPIFAVDDRYYQTFAEKLVDAHVIDWTIPGFHGSDFFVSIVYAVTGSPYSIHYFNMLCAILSPLLLYLLVTRMFGVARLGAYAAYAYLLMPITYASALRGFNFTPMIFFALLGAYFIWDKPKWSFLMGIAYVVKPFAIAFAPLFFYRKQIPQFFLSLLFPFVYVLAQYLSTGAVLIGQHAEYTTGSLFSFHRFLLNIPYAIQNYFSIHGFSPVHHAYLADMPHITPMVTVMATIGIIYHKEIHQNKKLFVALCLCALIALLLPMSFFYFDYWYLTMFNVTLILLALLPLYRFDKLLPVVVATSGFEFYYLLLSMPLYFTTDLSRIVLFSIWVLVLIISVIYDILRRRHEVNEGRGGIAALL